MRDELYHFKLLSSLPRAISYRNDDKADRNYKSAIKDPSCVVLEDGIRPFDHLNIDEIKAYWWSFYQNASTFALTKPELWLLCSQARSLTHQNVITKDVTDISEGLFSLFTKILSVREDQFERCLQSKEDSRRICRDEYSTLECIDAMEFLSTIIMLAGISTKEKVSLLFDSWDMSDDGTLEMDEFIISFKSTLYGLSKILIFMDPIKKKSSKNPGISSEDFSCSLDEEEVCDFAQSLFMKVTRHKDGNDTILRSEFEQLCLQTPKLRAVFNVMDRGTAQHLPDDTESRDVQIDNERVGVNFESEQLQDMIREAEGRYRDDVDQNGSTDAPTDSGDEFMAVKPWKGAVVPPSKLPKLDASAPSVSIKLEYVFGFNASLRNNVRYVPGSLNEITFPAAATSIVLDIPTNKQRHHVAHTDDIIAYGVHPVSSLVASGEIGKLPKIIIWETKTMHSVCTLKGFHEKGILQVAFFSPISTPNSVKTKSDRLITIGADTDHKIGIYESHDQWKSASLTFCSKGNKALVYHLATSSDGREWIACGEKCIEFWSIKENDVKKYTCKKAIMRKKGDLQAFLVVEYIDKSSAIIGTADGHLYHFRDHELVQVVLASRNDTVKKKHSAVYSLHVSAVQHTRKDEKKLLVSGCSDGSICVWSETLQLITGPFILDQALPHDLEVLQKFPKYRSIQSISFSHDNKKFLVGTHAAEIYELNASTGQNLSTNAILKAHFHGELWGLAVNPTNPDQCCTTGDDQTLRLWDLKECIQLRAVCLDTFARACAYSHDGKLIALGSYEASANSSCSQPRKVERSRSGTAATPNVGIMVFNAGDLSIFCVPAKIGVKRSITDVKFSPNDRVLIVTSLDGSIHLCDALNSFREVSTFRRHTSSVLHADFSSDGDYIASLSSGYEMLFMKCSTGKQIGDASQFRDEKWHTLSCPLGFWGVQGIWPPYSDGSDINSVDRANSMTMIATADDYGFVKIFRYPCAIERSSFVQLRGHSSHVTNVKWSASDRLLLSTGGRDCSLFVWKHESVDAALIKRLCLDAYKPVGPNLSEDPSTNSKSDSFNYLSSEFDDIGVEDLGDEFMAIKPWMGAILAPSKVISQNPESPSIELELSHIHGYQAQQARNNARYDKSGNIVYHAAAVGIIYDPSQQTQRFMKSHNDDIIALCAHTDRDLFATSQMGKKPSIFIWSSLLEKTPPVCIEGFHQRAVNAICFCSDKKKLGSVGMDDDHSIAIYNYANRQLVASARGDRNQVFSIAYNASSEEWITCGVKHIRFWKEQGKNLTSKRAIFRSFPATKKKSQQKETTRAPADTFECVTVFEKSGIVGGSDGFLYQFISGSHEANAIITAHSTSVYALYSNIDCLFSGSKDGTIHRRDAKLTLLQTIDLNVLLAQSSEFSQSFYDVSIRSLCTRQTGSGSIKTTQLLVGTGGSDILELNISSDRSKMSKVITRGHSRQEVWGLAMHPSRPEYVTAGDDQTARVWSLKTGIKGSQISSQLRSTRLEAMARACAVTTVTDSQSKQFDIVAVGFGGKNISSQTQSRKSHDVRRGTPCPQDCIGAITILRYNDLDQRIGFEKLSKQSVSELKFSPNSNILAVGSHDHNIYLFKVLVTKDDTIKLSRTSVFAKHQSYITHFDFSADSQHLQSNCGAYELLYSKTSSGQHLTSATSMRDVNWETWTCTLGWPVQGIWPPCSDGTDINAVSRNNKTEGGAWVVTGDDFGLVKMYRYPCLTKGSSVTLNRGHSSHVTNVRWSANDEYVISIGGLDRTVMEWRVVKKLDENKNSRQPGTHREQQSFSNTWEVDPKEDSRSQAPESNPTGNLAADPFVKEPLGDEFLAVKPWIGAIVPPNNLPVANIQEPNVRVKLDWVYGYQCELAKQNVYYNYVHERFESHSRDDIQSEIVYHTAAVGIIYDPKMHFQKHHLGHKDDILCLTVSPHGGALHHGLVATGERGRRPKIRIWDAHTATLQSEFNSNIHARGILSLAYNKAMTFLLSVGDEEDHSLVLWADHSQGSWKIVRPVASGKGEKARHHFAFFQELKEENQVQIVTGGEKHVLVWHMEGKAMVYKRGRIGKRGVLQNFPCGCSIRIDSASSSQQAGTGVFVTGTGTGDLYIWAGEELQKVVKGHNGSVDAVSAPHAGLTDNKIVLASGGRDGKIILWDRQMQGIKSCDLSLINLGVLRASIRSLCFHTTNKQILAGTASSDILELDVEAFGNNNAHSHKLLVSGHFLRELWGLAVHPGLQVCTTGGDDKTLRVWDLDARRLLRVHSLPYQARACAYSSDGKYFAIGFGSDNSSVMRRPTTTKPPASQPTSASIGEGSVMVVAVTEDRTSTPSYFDLIHPILLDRPAKEWISDIKFSPCCRFLAFGSHDNNIYIYHVQHSDTHVRIKRFKTFRKHHSYITHLDFSIDSSYLQSNCGAYELLFCDVATGEQVKSASKLRNTNWATWTCTLGWPVQGIWPEFADGTDINAVCASSSKLLLATGEDSGKVKIFRYPCTIKGAKAIEMTGHSSHISNVRFSMDDKYLLSTGADRSSIMEMNKDEAEKCRDLGIKYFQESNFQKAVKFFDKSTRLYPLPGVEALRYRAKQETERSQHANSMPNRNSTNNDIRNRQNQKKSNEVPKEKPYTADQQRIVQKIRACKTHYEVLSVSKSATEADVKKAYRKLALKLHPDKNSAPGAEEAFKAVGKAFAVLSDQEKRSHYDQYGSQGSGASQSNQRRAYYEEDISPEDIFNMFFGGGFRPPRRTHVRNRNTHPSPNPNSAGNEQRSGYAQLVQFLPLLLIFLVSLLMVPPSPETPFSLYPTGKYNIERITSMSNIASGISYYVDPSFEQKYTTHWRDLSRIERMVQQSYATEVENSSIGGNEFSDSDEDFESDSDFERETEFDKASESAKSKNKSKSQEKKRVSAVRKKSKRAGKSGDKSQLGARGKTAINNVGNESVDGDTEKQIEEKIIRRLKKQEESRIALAIEQRMKEAKANWQDEEMNRIMLDMRTRFETDVVQDPMMAVKTKQIRNTAETNGVNRVHKVKADSTSSAVDSKRRNKPEQSSSKREEIELSHDVDAKGESPPPPPWNNTCAVFKALRVVVWKHTFLPHVEFEADPKTGIWNKITQLDADESFDHIARGDRLIFLNGNAIDREVQSQKDIENVIATSKAPLMLKFQAQNTDDGKVRDYSVTWVNGPLGVTLKDDCTAEKVPIVNRLTRKAGSVAVKHNIAIGDILVAINNIDTIQLGCSLSMSILKKVQLPATLRFRGVGGMVAEVKSGKAQHLPESDVTVTRAHAPNAKAEKAKVPQSVPRPSDYTISWGNGPLGLTIIPGLTEHDPPVIKNITGTGTSPGIESAQIGDYLVSISSRSAQGIPFNEIVTLLKTAHKPVKLRFRATTEEDRVRQSEHFVAQNRNAAAVNSSAELQKQHSVPNVLPKSKEPHRKTPLRAQSLPSTDHDVYNLVWGSGPLGLTIDTIPNHKIAYIKRIGNEGAASTLTQDCIGDELTHINELNIRHLDFPQVIQQLKIVPRPVTLRFRKDESAHNTAAPPAPYANHQHPYQHHPGNVLPPSMTGALYEVIWHEGHPLGLSLHSADEYSEFPYITRVTGTGSAAHLPNSVVGDRLISVLGYSVHCRDRSFDEMMNMLKTMPKPMSLKFDSTSGIMPHAEPAEPALTTSSQDLHQPEQVVSRRISPLERRRDEPKEKTHDDTTQSSSTNALLKQDSNRSVVEEEKFSTMHAPFLVQNKLSTNRRQRMLKGLKKTEFK
uniref:HCG1784313 putative n=1 Tax=Albugo laibachii Nc14 TaxID=890382 RepID=F0W297_9STRA|nr:hCG1784313 putative [Albugo laibachii Nc14]|eukprot:CCA15182.1 hCG1784313 putative [Albugo laibachii Nc14]